MPPTTRSNVRMSGGIDLTSVPPSFIPLPPSPSAAPPPIVLSPLSSSIASDRTEARFDAIALEMARSNDLARQSSDLQREEIARLTALISSIAVNQQPQPTPPAQPAPSIALAIPTALPSYLPPLMIPPPPTPFSGSERSQAQMIVNSAEIVYRLNPAHFVDALGAKKVDWFASFLTGDAYQWYDNMISSASPSVASWSVFRSAFLRNWGTQSSSADAWTSLINLRQTTPTITHNATFNSILNRVSDPPAYPHLVATFVNSLYDRHRHALNGIRLSRYGGDGDWPSLLEVQTSARDLEVQSPGYSSAAAAPPRPRPLPVHTLSSSEYPALPPPSAPPSYPAFSRYTPSVAPSSVAPSSPPRLNVLLAQTPRANDQDRADRKARADEREARGLCRYCGEPGHKVDACVALARKEASKDRPGPPHPKG